MSMEKMEDTLDSIRPSENPTEQEEISYLFSRDPSILAYGQRRPLITDELKKNLISHYEDEQTDSRDDTTSSLSSFSQTVKVYLRLKPYPKRIELTEEQKEAYTILNTTTLLTKLPYIDTNASCLKRAKNSDTVCRKFTFTKTFSSTTSQLEIFENAIKQQMIDFLAGQNSTVMSYGTTNSGKSYTLQGTTVSPGIIPRSLDFVFSNIDSKSVPCYKPVHYCDVICLNSSERLQELEYKTKILYLSSIDRNHCVNTYKEMQKLLEKENPNRESVSIDAQYSVWVSFAEIYNETIYDLLSVEPQKRRIPLKLATDNHGRAFIKGLKTICVNSASEAYQILMAGQHNLKVATTALNSRSSRSHCIFTIKLLKYYAENASEKVEISSLSFCDLAGSERLKKTLNVGDRLKEAQNINTSLLVLGRCLKSIYEGQTVRHKQEVIGPFRESKLTRLFQKTLSGKEHLVLIVNVNPSPDLYIETQNVLNFSAIAKKIIIEPKEVKRKAATSRFSQIVTQSIKTCTDWDATDLNSISEEQESIAASHKSYEEIYLEDYQDALNENEKLRREIQILRSSALNRDLEIRQEMAESFSSIMSQMEVEWRDRIKSVEEQQDSLLQWSVARTENFYKNKLVQLGKRKRTHSSTNDDSDNDDNEELQLENIRLKATIAALKKTVKEIRDSKDTLSADKSKTTFELAIVKEELKNLKNLLEAAQKDCNGEARNYIAELNVLLAKKDEQIKNLKMFLDEAKEEYITITTDAREMQNRLKLQNKTIVEHMDQIAELEEQLEYANIQLPQKTKAVEVLEEKIEFQTKELIKSENIIVDMQTKISQFETDKIALMEELAKLQEIIIDHDKKSTPTSFQDVEVKSELQEEKVEDQLQAKESLQQNILVSPRTKQEESHQNLESQECISEMKQMLCDNEKQIKEYESNIKSLKEDLVSITMEKENIQSELNQVQNSKESLELKVITNEKNISELEKAIKENADREIQITQDLATVRDKLNNALSKETNYEEVIQKLEKELSAANERYEIKAKEMTTKEQEMENELANLQKELKNMIRLNADSKTDQEMEASMKQVLKQLTETKEALTKMESLYKDTETEKQLCHRKIESMTLRLQQYEQKAKILDLLQQTSQERQIENEQLKKMNAELKNSLAEQDREMETFRKNREEMATKYDDLIKSQQEEIEKQKREVMKYRPSVEVTSEKKRTTRKKKLFVQSDDAAADIDPCETIPPSPLPSTSTRSLRTRRK